MFSVCVFFYSAMQIIFLHNLRSCNKKLITVTYELHAQFEWQLLAIFEKLCSYFNSFYAECAATPIPTQYLLLYSAG